MHPAPNKPGGFGPMIIPVVQMLGGFVLLVWAADRLVVGASAMARNLGVAPLVIGLTIIAFGTSFPELVVSAMAAFQGKPGLAVGNAIGSNIANIGMVLGITALFYPLRVDSTTLKREYPQLLLVMVICLIMGANLSFSRQEGTMLLIGLALLIIWMVRLGMRREPDDPIVEDFETEIPADMRTRTALLWVAVGLLILPLSSHILVLGAISVAMALGVSEVTIGLTVVAIGTSLPELAAAVTSARRGEDDLAIGNVLGSNMFNVLGVLGVAATVKPVSFDELILKLDIPVMFLFTVLLFFMAYGIDGPGRISRRSGALLLLLFLAYQLLAWACAKPYEYPLAG